MEDFQSAFNDADVVFVTPVYAAGEEPIEGADSELAEGLRARVTGAQEGGTDSPTDLRQTLRDLAAEGDLIVAWAPATSPGGRLVWPRNSRKRGVEEMSSTPETPKVRGKLTPTAPLARWSGSRGAERGIPDRAEGRGRLA